MARLEAPHSAEHVGIVDVGTGRVRIDVAGGGEPGTQRDDGRMPVAELQHVDGRNLRPAAARDDRRVALDRLLGGLRGRRPDRRLGRLRHVDGAGGLIEALAERSLLGVADQGIEGRVFRQRAARGYACSGKRGSATQPAQEGAPVRPGVVSIMLFRHR